MRWHTVVIGIMLAGWTGVVRAEDRRETGDKIFGGVMSGLLGQPQDEAYVAQERERLVSLLQGGDYVTSRQGEPVDLMMLGVPLTRTDHVYTARPVPPSQSSSRR